MATPSHQQILSASHLRVTIVAPTLAEQSREPKSLRLHQSTLRRPNPRITDPNAQPRHIPVPNMHAHKLATHSMQSVLHSCWWFLFFCPRIHKNVPSASYELRIKAHETSRRTSGLQAGKSRKSHHHLSGLELRQAKLCDELLLLEICQEAAVDAILTEFVADVRQLQADQVVAHILH